MAFHPSKGWFFRAHREVNCPSTAAVDCSCGLPLRPLADRDDSRRQRLSATQSVKSIFPQIFATFGGKSQSSLPLVPLISNKATPPFESFRSAPVSALMTEVKSGS